MSATVGAPTDEQLLDVLVPAVGPIEHLRRERYWMETSFPLEEVWLELADGRRLDLIFKDLAWERLIGDAPQTKPPFLHDPRRTVETHRALLEPLGLEPRFVAGIADVAGGRSWLFTEKVDGTELWQVGEVQTWRSVAAWLRGFHDVYRGRTDDALLANPYLLTYDRWYYRFWADRAVAALAAHHDERADELLALLRGYHTVVDALDALEPALIHGELYPSNVLVGGTDAEPQVWLVDWEMAAVGAAALDLAAVSTGWAHEHVAALVAAYHGAAESRRSLAELEEQVVQCRLHLALRWLGWARGWSPPSEHDHDWIGEAIGAATALGL